MRTRRRHRTHQPPQCQACHYPIKWIRLAATGAWRKFNPTPVDGRTHPHGAMPIWGTQAWEPVTLAAEISVQRGCGPTEAAAEVLDLPWYRKHACEHYTPADHDDAPDRQPEGQRA